jgi:hypothetical protein
VGITVVGNGNWAWKSTGTTVDVPYPASLAEDDILILELYHNNSGGSITTPSGFTLINENTAGSKASRIYWARAAGTESGDLTVTTNVYSCGAIMSAWRGCIDTGSPIDDDSVLTGFATTVNFIAITPSVDNCMIVGIIHIADDVAITPNASYTELFDYDIGYYEFGLEYALQTTATSTGTVATVIGGNDSHHAHLIALIEKGGQELSDTVSGGISLTDSILNVDYGVTRAGTLSLVGSKADTTTYSMIEAGSVVITGSEQDDQGVLISSGIGLTASEDHTLAYTQYPAVVVSLVGSEVPQFDLNAIESAIVSLSESLTYPFARAVSVSDTIELLESTTNGMGVSQAASITLADSEVHQLALSQSETAVLSLTESEEDQQVLSAVLSAGISHLASLVADFTVIFYTFETGIGLTPTVETSFALSNSIETGINITPSADGIRLALADISTGISLTPVESHPVAFSEVIEDQFTLSASITSPFNWDIDVEVGIATVSLTPVVDVFGIPTAVLNVTGTLEHIWTIATNFPYIIDTTLSSIYGLTTTLSSIYGFVVTLSANGGRDITSQYELGETVPIEVEIYNPAGTKVDPTTTKISIKSPSRTTVVDAVSMDVDGTGEFSYKYKPEEEVGDYTFKIVATDANDNTSIYKGEFDIVRSV